MAMHADSVEARVLLVAVVALHLRVCAGRIIAPASTLRDPKHSNMHVKRLSYASSSASALDLPPGSNLPKDGRLADLVAERWAHAQHLQPDVVEQAGMVSLERLHGALAQVVLRAQQRCAAAVAAAAAGDAPEADHCHLSRRAADVEGNRSAWPPRALNDRNKTCLRPVKGRSQGR